MINMDASCGNSYFSIIRFQIRVALLLFLYACLRFHPSDKNSTSLNFHTTGASEKKSIQGVPLPIHYFRNDFYSVTSSVAFERRFLELRFQQFDFAVSVPVESSSSITSSASSSGKGFDLEQCDIYDCSFTLLRDLFFNGTNFSAGFAPFGDDSVALASEKRRVSDLKMIRGVAKLYQRTFEKFRYHDIRQRERLRVKYSSMLNHRPTAVKGSTPSHKPEANSFFASRTKSLQNQQLRFQFQLIRAKKNRKSDDRSSSGIETPEQFKGSSAPSCSPSQVSNVEATLKKPSTAFSSVYASKGRLDTPVMDMNIAALKSSMDDGNIQNVIDVLQNNIRQWSFIESQLLEPNANLGMPEIFIPLRHLTTTLEILGNILFMKNDFVQAKEYLERACPLIELLPPSGPVSGFGESGYGADGQSFGQFSRGGEEVPSGSAGHGSIGEREGDGGLRNQYAEGCFKVLRDVYGKLYGSGSNGINSRDTRKAQTQQQIGRSGKQKHQRKQRRQSHCDSMSRSKKTDDDCIGCESGDFDPELEDGYVDSSVEDELRRPENLQDDFYVDEIDDEGSADRPHFSDYYYDDHNDDAIDQNNEEYSGPLEDGDYYGGVPGALVRSEGESFDSERKIEELRLPFEHLRSDRSSHSSQRNWDVNHIGLKKRRGYIRTARRPSSNRLDAELSRSRHCIMDQMADESCDGNGNEDCPCDASELDQAEAPLARPDPLLGSYSKVTSWSQGDDEILKSAESSGSSSKGRSKAKASVTVPVGSEIGTGNDGDRSSRRPRRMVEGSAWSTSVPSALQGDDLLLLELGENGALPKQASAAALSHSFASSPHALFAAFHSLGLDSEGFHNSATSIIAGDLEDMLRTFVLEDSIGRNNVLSIARKYYEDLDINFPNMDYTEYAANMDLGQVFLEVMTSVNEKGFAFIAPELERWQELGQVILSSSMPKSGWQEKRFLPEGCSDIDDCPARSSQRHSQRQKRQNYQLADDEKDAGTNYGTNRAEYSRAKQAVAEDDVYLDDTDESSSDHDFDVDMDEKEQASERQGGVRYSGGDIEVDLDGAYFNSFSLADRNRLLILSAFDIASNTDSFETFDLRLGLALGIVDNDKSRSLGSSSQVHFMSLSSQPPQPAQSDALPKKKIKKGKGKRDKPRIEPENLIDELDEKSSRLRNGKVQNKMMSEEEGDTLSSSNEGGGRQGSQGTELLEGSEDKIPATKRRRKRDESNVIHTSELDANVNIIPHDGPSDPPFGSFEEETSENVGIPPLFRSAIPTLKSEGIIASCFLLFVASVGLLVLVLSQQDVQRRKGRTRTVRTPRQKTGVVDTVVGVLSGSSFENVEGSILHHMGNLTISSTQAAFQQSVQMFLTTIADFLPHNSNEPTSQKLRTDREKVSATDRDGLTSTNFNTLFSLMSSMFADMIAYCQRQIHRLTPWKSGGDNGGDDDEVESESDGCNDSQSSSDGNSSDFAAGNKGLMKIDGKETRSATSSGSSKKLMSNDNQSVDSGNLLALAGDNKKEPNAVANANLDSNAPSTAVASKKKAAPDSKAGLKNSPQEVTSLPATNQSQPGKVKSVQSRKPKLSPSQLDALQSFTTNVNATSDEKRPPAGTALKPEKAAFSKSSSSEAVFAVRTKKDNSWTEVVSHSKEKKSAEALKREEAAHSKNLAPQDSMSSRIPAFSPDRNIADVGKRSEISKSNRVVRSAEQQAALASNPVAPPGFKSVASSSLPLLSSELASPGASTTSSSSPSSAVQHAQHPLQPQFQSQATSSNSSAVRNAAALNDYSPASNSSQPYSFFSPTSSIIAASMGVSAGPPAGSFTPRFDLDKTLQPQSLFFNMDHSEKRDFGKEKQWASLPPPPGIAAPVDESRNRTFWPYLDPPMTESKFFGNLPAQISSPVSSPPRETNLHLSTFAAGDLLRQPRYSQRSDGEFWSMQQHMSASDPSTSLRSQPSMVEAQTQAQTQVEQQLMEDYEILSSNNPFLGTLDFMNDSDSPFPPGVVGPGLEEQTSNIFGHDGDLFTSDSNLSFHFLHDLVSTPDLIASSTPAFNHELSVAASSGDGLPSQSHSQRLIGGSQQDAYPDNGAEDENDYNTTSITKQASTLHMLSPNAPSFTPSYSRISHSMTYAKPLTHQSDGTADEMLVNEYDFSVNTGESLNDSAAAAAGGNGGLQRWGFDSYGNGATSSSTTSASVEFDPSSLGSSKAEKKRK